MELKRKKQTKEKKTGEATTGKKERKTNLEEEGCEKGGEREREREAGAQRRRRRLDEEKGKDFGTPLSPLIASPSFPRNVQHALEPSPLPVLHPTRP